MYVDRETMPVEDYLPDTRIFVDNCNKMLTPGPVPKHGLYLVTCVQNIMTWIKTLMK